MEIRLRIDISSEGEHSEREGYERIDLSDCRLDKPFSVKIFLS